MMAKLSRRVFLVRSSGFSAAIGAASSENSPIRLMHVSAFDGPFVASSLRLGTPVSVERRETRFYITWSGRVLGRLPFSAGLRASLASHSGTPPALRLVRVARSAQGRLILEVST